MQSQMYPFSGFGDHHHHHHCHNHHHYHHHLMMVLCILMAFEQWQELDESQPGSDWGWKARKEEKQKEEKQTAFLQPLTQGKYQQISGKVYPDTFRRVLENLEWNANVCEYVVLFTVQDKLLRKWILFFPMKFSSSLIFQPWAQCRLLSPTKLLIGGWDH